MNTRISKIRGHRPRLQPVGGIVDAACCSCSLTCKSYDPFARWGCLTVLFLSIASLALAHDPGLSTAALKIFPDRLDAEVIFARADIEALVPLDANSDGNVSPEELSRARSEFEPLVRNALQVRVNGTATIITGPSFELDENNNFRMAGAFPAHSAKALTVESPLIKQLPRGHRQFITVLDNQGVTLAEALLSTAHNAIALDMPAPLAQEIRPTETATFREFFVMGVEHILTGLDHLLFLFALLIAMSQFRATVWVITCFTLAHSTTLALAAFDVVRIPGRVVEPLIAATIIYVGAENLLRSGDVTGRWRLALAFGLVHGLGFATDLKERLADMIGPKIVLPLVSFNLGVELGQMAVAALALPLIWWLRTEPTLPRRWTPVCSALVVLAGAWWLFERTLLG